MAAPDQAQDEGGGRRAGNGYTTHAWEYQWEDGLNAAERAVSPWLPTRLAQEVARSAAAAAVATIFLRGELGIGKSTLARILTSEELGRVASSYPGNPRLQNGLRTCEVLEASDLESADEFAARVNRVSATSSVIVLGRPATIDAAAQWIRRSPSATVTMNTFEPTRPTFRTCLENVARTHGLMESQVEELARMAQTLPPFMCTPFYFGVLAGYVGDPDLNAPVTSASPLQLLQTSLELRLGRAGYQDLVEAAIGAATDGVDPIPGILGSDGTFIHDGYRSVVIAASVLSARIGVSQMARLPNSMSAMKTLLDHVERKADGQDAHTLALIQDLDQFVATEIDIESVDYLVFIQGLVAATLRKLRRETAAETLRARCMALIEAHEQYNADTHAGGFSTLWWDVSDALSLIGDPRLRKARTGRYDIDSGYFTMIERQRVVIGSNHTPTRRDDAKPVLPYRRQEVEIGPLLVANFLVTNELYRDFWSDPRRERYFTGTGRQWLDDDPSLMKKIATSFDVTARRCFWKEVADEEAAAIAGLGSGSVSILDVARMRALRQGRVSLFDPTQADNRFSANGSPVVGVTWWEAMAFTRWWQVTRLPDARLPFGDAEVNLLTDWEWEAVRRICHDETTLSDDAVTPTARFGAHLRNTELGKGLSGGRTRTVMRPLHVGLFPPPSGFGPYDMVGNVWEWTRSRVYGRIRSSWRSHPPYGKTAWTHGDPTMEREAQVRWRDETEARGDLTYRSTRGASFFSVDPQAAWNPAYRLCDPPYSSYFDLGFRIAIYPRTIAQ